MARMPWFPFYPSDFLGAERVQLMTNEQVGMYVKLLCHQWMEGSIPEKSSNAIAVLRLGWGDASEMEDFKEVVSTCFVPHPTENGRLINRRLEQIRTEQEEISLKRQEAGRAGGYAKARLAMPGICHDFANSKPLAESSYSESNPNSKSESNSETKKDIGLVAIASNGSTLKRVTNRGSVLPEGFAFNERAEEMAKGYGLNVHKEFAAFRDHHVAKGTIFKDWQAAFRTWLRNAVKFSAKVAR